MHAGARRRILLDLPRLAHLTVNPASCTVIHGS